MQQLFRLLIFLNQPYVFRATKSPILRSTFFYIYSFWYNAPTLLPTGGTGRQQCRCIAPKSVYTVKKCSWGWAHFSPETLRADLKRLINEKLVAACWLLTSFWSWISSGTPNFQNHFHRVEIQLQEINIISYRIISLQQGHTLQSNHKNQLLY